MIDPTTRDLIQRLADALERYLDRSPAYHGEEEGLLDEARAVLSQPESEEPTDGEKLADEASLRIKKFLNEYKKIRGLDPDVIYGLHAGPDDHRTAFLTVSDLHAVLARYGNRTPAPQELEGGR
jgi:hypothetical protein